MEKHHQVPSSELDAADSRPDASRNWALPMGLALGAAAAGALWGAIRKPNVPAGLEPVADWNPKRYMGHWYELARVDHRFERGLIRTQADYTLLPDNTVHVLNRGFDPETERWKSSSGKGRFVDDPSVAALKVSFFGPFYGGYNVIALDPDYRWSLVIGSSLEYCWILSRSPEISDDLKARLTRQAALAGVSVDALNWVHQDGVSW